MKGIYISASGAIQGHHGPLVGLIVWCLTHDQTTNFRLFQNERVHRQQFQKMARKLSDDENGRKLSERVENTVGKRGLLITSSFSFSHSDFKRLVSQGRQKVSLCGNGLMPFQQYFSYIAVASAPIHAFLAFF